MDSLLRTFGDRDLQAPSDVAVVMPTMLRPSIERALASVFAQDFPGTVHVLIGVDVAEGGLEPVERALRHRPAHISVQVLYPGYSTARRHGGLYRPTDGGALRLILTLLANSRHVAYLDDDNWWGPEHLRTLRRAVGLGDWAYSLRWYVHPASLAPICVDRWESVGPGLGVFTEKAGGFVDPNTLMLDKLTCADAVANWVHPRADDPSDSTADRNVFAALAAFHRGVGTNQASAFYVLNPADDLHPHRLGWIGEAYGAAGI